MKRLFLNISFICLAFSIGIFAYRCYENSYLHKCSAVFSGYRSYNADGSDIKPEVTFTVNGKEYTRTFAESTDANYEIGDKTEILYDSRDPGDYVYRHYSWVIIIPLMLIGLILIIVCREAFKGYWSDFVCRYPKACICTVISILIPFFYLIWYEYFFVCPDAVFAGLTEVLFMCALLIIAPVTDIIVWITAVLKYKNKNKIAEQTAYTE